MVQMKKPDSRVVPRVLLTEAEQEERERTHLARLNDVIATCAYFKNFQAHFKELEGQRAENESWEQYMKCGGLPDPKSPGDIRTFLSKLRHCDDLEAASTTDWTLSVDERSVLTQNIFRKDLTRKVVEKSKCTSPGPYFEMGLRNCLEVLRQVDVLMDNEVGIERLGPRTQSEILSVYGEVQREIETLFDRLTYRVLAMQKAIMKSVDGIVAIWSHSADQWSMDIWGLLNVPIIFEHMQVPAMTAEFPVTGIRVQMPLSILTDCLTLRCVHTSFDHHSQDAKSYELPAIDHNGVPYASIVDMEESVISEWQIQQDIQEEVLSSMQRKYKEYEELMQLIAERTEKAAKNAKNDKDNEKIFIPKTPKEVRPVPPGMVPEVYDDFLSREKLHYAEYMDNCFHPKLLDILPNEINLREHIIVGGIYSLMFVEAPDQTQFQHFNIALHHDRRVLRIIPDVVAEKHRFSGSARSSKSISTANILDDNELPFFIVTVKLPPDLCKWGKPRVCQCFTELQRASRTSHRQLSKEPSSDSISTIHQSSIKSNEGHSVLAQREEEQAEAMDFSLEKSLHMTEFRSLAAHCVPRIISSFKFPVEFHEQEAAEFSPKVKRFNLLKYSETPDVREVALPEANYDYSMQDQPERMFPMFPDASPVQFASDDTGSCNNKSASGVVRTFSNIKRQYGERPLNILQQEESPERVNKKDKKLDLPDDPWDINNWEESVPVRKKKSSVSKASISSRKSSINRVSNSGSANFQHGHQSVRKLRRVPSVTIPTQLLTVTHWTTGYILDENIDPETNTLTFRTDRLGMFGLAFKRYEHFPFGEWCLQSNEDNPDEVILSLNTHHVSMFFYITSQGVRGYVTDLAKGYVAHPVKYLEIKEPISDFRELRQTLVDKNFNIFPGNDASFYISNGYHSVKHLATEMHTYSAMALYCGSMKFSSSSWNRLADRRDLIVDMKVAKDQSEFTEVTVRITPEKTTFVKVSEVCSDNINDVKLQYEETWRNVNNYVDLSSAISSMNPTAQEACNKTTMLFINIKRLLSEIRPLSFS